MDGQASLAELDEQSLALRGKKSKVKDTTITSKVLSKRKAPVGTLDNSKTSPSSKKIKIDLTEDDHIDLTQESETEDTANDIHKDRKELEAMIDTSEKTDFQKKCLKLLIQIPEGHFSTYGKHKYRNY